MYKMLSIVLLIVALSIIVIIQYPQYTGGHAAIQAAGLTLFHAGIIFIFYLLGKFTVEDGKQRTHSRLFWFVVDKVVLTVAVMYMTTLNYVWDSSAANYALLLLLVILLDPAGLIGRAISETGVIRDGYFLRGVVTGKRESVGDYIGAMVLLVILYWVLLTRLY